jgi:hypothetical protein
MTEWLHIELSYGRVTKATLETAAGVRAVPEMVGQMQFYVDAVDREGGRVCLVVADDYEDAIRKAETARRDFDIDTPVKDTVAGA